MSQGAADGAQKLTIILGPMLDALKRDINERNVVNTQEILFTLGRLEAKMDLMEKLCGDKKRSGAIREKKPAASTDGQVVPAETPVAIPANVPKNFPVNKLVYFRERFKTDEAYRAKYITPEIKELMDKEQSIASKAEGAQKFTAQAGFCWAYFRTNNKQEVTASIDNEYQTAKRAYEASMKPESLTVEEHTPPPKN